MSYIVIEFMQESDDFKKGECYVKLLCFHLILLYG